MQTTTNQNLDKTFLFVAWTVGVFYVPLLLSVNFNKGNHPLYNSNTKSPDQTSEKIKQFCDETSENKNNSRRNIPYTIVDR